MTIEKIKLFIRASRPFSLTASAIPVVLGEILALKSLILILNILHFQS
ncbi:1,4-dihydroxy-2-naphthoate octaprenyltransferase [Clostridium beijerinckii]|nr:1,4-dihydroxy-2-naphthoate octaprenyltransferase [Clostridium beijerinckii]